MIVILDNIRSMNNVGSVFRTADAAGVEKIYLCGITPEPFDRLGRPHKQFVKVSLGAEQSVPWEKVGSTVRLIMKLKKEGYGIIAVEQADRAVPYYRLDLRLFPKKRAVIFGNEIEGISPKVLDCSDRVTDILMRGAKESLNVSVACGIILFHLRYGFPDMLG